MARSTYLLFGFIPLWAVDYDLDEEPQHIHNTSGEFERAPAEDDPEGDEYLEEEYKFGFGV